MTDKNNAMVKFTPELQATFLDELRRTGRWAHSAEAVGVHYNTVYLHRKKDPAFEAECTAALEYFRDVLVEAAVTRAVDGIEETIYNKDGEITGTRIKYSDRLLELLLKRHDPKFRDSHQIDVKVDAQVGVLLVQAPSADSASWKDRFDGKQLPPRGQGLNLPESVVDSEA